MPILILILFFFASPAFAEESSSPSPSPSPQGRQVAHNVFLQIPDDMKVEKVANNVITTEPDIEFLARKMEEQNKRLEAIEARLAALDSQKTSQ